MKGTHVKISPRSPTLAKYDEYEERLYIGDIIIADIGKSYVKVYPDGVLFSITTLETEGHILEKREVKATQEMINNIKTTNDPIYLEILIKLILNNDDGTEN